MTTNTPFQLLRNTRNFLLDGINGLSLEQVNKVPSGFNNNIAWNVAHMVAALEGVCYLRGGLPDEVDLSFYEQYKPGTKPAADISETEWAQIKERLLTCVDKLEQDYQQGRFSQYTEWTSRYGITHRTIDDTLQFLPFHDGIHTGYVLALKRCL